MAELYMLRPLFPGSSEVCVCSYMCVCLGCVCERGGRMRVWECVRVAICVGRCR
jgi:hypothetical protein